MRDGARGVWLAPLLVAAASGTGLVAALLGDGVWDWLGWAGLAIPVLVIAAALLIQARERPSR